MFLFCLLRCSISMLILHEKIASVKVMEIVDTECETAHEVRGTSALRRPKPTLCGLRPRTFEARMCLDCMKKGHPPDVLFHATESARRDSNPRPRPWQGRAPPTEPLAHFRGLFTRRKSLYYSFSRVVNYFCKISYVILYAIASPVYYIFSLHNNVLCLQGH